MRIMLRGPRLARIAVGIIVGLMCPTVVRANDGAGAATAEILVAYSRAGGGRPGAGDAERLSIDGSGGFELRRTVGGARIGHFAGTVPATKQRSLRTAVASLRSSFSSSERVAPGSVTERIATARFTFDSSYDGGISASWTRVLTQVRSLTESLVSSPVAGLELSVTSAGLRAELRHIGTKPVDIAGDLVVVTAALANADDVITGRWRTEIRLPSQSAAHGWRVDLGLERSGLRLSRGQHLIVSAGLDIVGDDGVRRPASMTVTAA